MTDQTNKDLLALKAVRDEIGQWISDPMWADHAELPKKTLKRWHHVLHAAISASAPAEPSFLSKWRGVINETCNASAPAAGSVPSDLSIVELARFHAIDHEHWSPERIEAFAADVLAQYGNPAWQPIETAPKDGREMFVVKAFNVTNENCHVRNYTSDPYCVWPGTNGGWVRWPHPFTPTHWMAIPTDQQEGK